MELNISAGMCSLTGYSEIGREICLGLDKLGTVIHLKLLDESMLESSRNSLPEDVLDLIKRCRTKKLPPEVPTFTVGTPPQYDIRPGRCNIGIGLFEAYSVPPAWLQLMNTMSLILTTSSFNKTVFIRQGLSADKIVIVPPAVNSALFNPDVEPFYIKDVRPFTILFLGQMILRKGYDKLIIAALRTFRRNDDVCLILKLPPTRSEAQEAGMYKRMQAIKKEAGPSKVPVYFNCYPIPVEKVPRVYQAVRKKFPGKIYQHLNGDSPRGIFALPSLGEGLGLPLLESMASGVLTLGTNVTGSGAFLNTGNAVIIESGPPVRNLELELESSLYRGSPFPQISLPAIETALLKAYNMSTQEREQITSTARRDAESYTYERCCQQILQAIQSSI